MLKSDAIAYFGSVNKMAEALKVTQSAVSQWKDPLDWRTVQCAIEVVSKRKLRAEREASKPV